MIVIGTTGNHVRFNYLTLTLRCLQSHATHVSPVICAVQNVYNGVKKILFEIGTATNYELLMTAYIIIYCYTSCKRDTHVYI